MVGEGFEPSKAFAGRFTVCSRWPLRYPTDFRSFLPVNGHPKWTDPNHCESAELTGRIELPTC